MEWQDCLSSIAGLYAKYGRAITDEGPMRENPWIRRGIATALLYSLLFAAIVMVANSETPKHPKPPTPPTGTQPKNTTRPGQVSGPAAPVPVLQPTAPSPQNIVPKTGSRDQTILPPTFTPPSPSTFHKADEDTLRQKLLQATAPGTHYSGTITAFADIERQRIAKQQRIQIVFTEQNDFSIRAEVSNPDDPQQKQTFVGELLFDAKPGNDGLSYRITMSKVGKQGNNYSLDYFAVFYSRPGPIKLRLTNHGLEGEAEVLNDRDRTPPNSPSTREMSDWSR